MALTWKNMSDPVFHWASKRPKSLAMVEGETRLTYAELAAHIGRAAAWVHDLGVKPGDVVAVAQSNNADHVILSFGLMRAGAVVLDMPPRRPPSPADPVKMFGLSRVFVGPDAQALKGVPAHEVGPDWRQSLGKKKLDHRHVGDPDKVWYLSVTLGSTGIPKGIVTTHRQWLARYESAVALFPKIFDSAKPSNLIVAGGLGFSAFFFFLANQLFIGGPLIMLPEDPDRDRLVERIAAWDDATCLITPPVCRDFLQRAPAKGVLFPKMRALFIGASPLFPEEKHAAVKHLTANLHEVYGSAAVGFISALLPGDILKRDDTVGRVAPGLEVEIVGDDRKPAAPGHIGHMRCRGPGVSASFLGPKRNDPHAAEGFIDGWYYPGDLGTIDSKGYICLKGRASDMIVRRGVEILAPEIEQVLSSHPSVAEAAVIVGTAPEKGERVVGFVVPRGVPDKAALGAYCRERIPAEKFPDTVYYLKEMPKTATGKVNRAKLKSMGLHPPAAKG